MSIRDIFFGIAGLALLMNVVTLVLIMTALDRQGYKTNILLSRLYWFKYLSAYKEATRRETGKPGLLFYLWIGSIIAAAIAFLMAVLGPWA